MKTILTIPVILLICTACPALMRAQAARTDTPANIGGRAVTTSGTVAHMDADATGDATKVSPRASSAITAGFKYEPPPPPKPQDDEVDLRDIDKPQNTIIRLPKYTVTARRPPVFSDRGLYTQEQLRRLAMARYLSALDKRLLNRWTFADIGLAIGTSNADRAMEMYLEDERLQNMSAKQQQISILRVTGNTDAAQQMKSEYYDMFLRPQDKVNARPDSLLRQLGK